MEQGQQNNPLVLHAAEQEFAKKRDEAKKEKP